jgi:hypothetical protein
MQLYCRSEDKAVFEEIGFVFQSERGGTAYMIDEEANYAHAGDLPNDVVFRADYSAGDEYPGGEIVCDGNTYTERDTIDGDYFFKVFPDGKTMYANDMAHLALHTENMDRVTYILGLGGRRNGPDD